MGYTHYWTNKDISLKAWRAITNDVRKLIAASLVPLAREYDEPSTPPEVTDERIFLNGVGDDGYETFVLTRAADIDCPFCKTDRRPYDKIVCAILIVANHHAPKRITVESDGGMSSFVADYPGPHNEEWDVALAFVRQTLGAEYRLPPLIEFRSLDLWRRDRQARTAA